MYDGAIARRLASRQTSASGVAYPRRLASRQTSASGDRASAPRSLPANVRVRCRTCALRSPIPYVFRRRGNVRVRRRASARGLAETSGSSAAHAPSGCQFPTRAARADVWGFECFRDRQIPRRPRLTGASVQSSVPIASEPARAVSALALGEFDAPAGHVRGPWCVVVRAAPLHAWPSGTAPRGAVRRRTARGRPAWLHAAWTCGRAPRSVDMRARATAPACRPAIDTISSRADCGAARRRLHFRNRLVEDASAAARGRVGGQRVGPHAAAQPAREQAVISAAAQLGGLRAGKEHLGIRLRGGTEARC